MCGRPLIKGKPRDFEKRKVSAKDERFHEKRKVSRENREVSLLIKWPANNLNTLNVWPAKDKDLEQIPKMPISVKASFLPKTKNRRFLKNDITLYFHN